MEEKVEFTKYVQLQMQEREINHEAVLDTLKSPGQILSGKKERKIAQKKLDRGGQKGLLRVIFEEGACAKVVITVCWTPKIEKYWR
ncbi:hypothetical protein HKBW3S42_00295 [Candidatus Hakubella thermalkaliphila]|uniref:DUF4258 domain-containing protein n=1 Tax=Candidatus Hakubella thermalkaliphila TaxID=2754717 RepID=A0A6V8PH08_9ACTN|nr:hypothetical protein HKBW3S42_00295 [Candidatus Hakubella thermalkaliphila]